MFSRVASAIGRRLAHFLERERPGYTAFSVIPLDRLEAALRPGDVLLVEGNSRISSAIKYLTHSTWSHSAFYAGGKDPSAALIEADLENGVQAVSLARHAHLNTRICRPVGLTDADRRKVVAHMRRSIGRSYDLRNVFDLMRYLLPNPPVPQRWRRRMLELGSGDPTRAICSTLIAEAFHSVRYPILPELAESASRQMRLPANARRGAAHSPPLPFHAARFRSLALFQDHQAHDRGRFRLPAPDMGRSPGAAIAATIAATGSGENNMKTAVKQGRTASHVDSSCQKRKTTPNKIFRSRSRSQGPQGG